MRYDGETRFLLYRDTNRPYEIRDLDSGCGDPECCGSPWPQYYVWLEGRNGWYGGFDGDDAFTRADVFVRRLERWNVK